MISADTKGRMKALSKILRIVAALVVATLLNSFPASAQEAVPEFKREFAGEAHAPEEPLSLW